MHQNSPKTGGDCAMGGAGDGGPPRRTLRKFTAEEVAFMRDYAEQGYTVAAIAEALGRTPGTVGTKMRGEGIDYVRTAYGGWRTRTPRIFNGSAPHTQEETIARILSAGRRSTTLADVAREAGVTPELAERVLQRHAPTVWRYRIKGGLLPPGGIIARVAGEWAERAARLADNGLRHPRDYDTLIGDYGPDEAWRWLERLQADHHALRDLRRELRNALERAEREDR
jgi:predicted transcriptional regulator